tara:strand:- start:2436 stop:3683 length:1248 start_codon:yes stop_codon:yes gene_type:complete
MKLLFENWRQYLTEMAAKTSEELPESWFIKISALQSVRGANGVRVELVEKDEEGNLRRIPGRRDPWSSVTAYKAEPGAAPCLGAYIIEGSSAPHGFGPLLYDIMMELAGKDGLTPDRSIVSSAAYNVWQYYLKNRSDIDNKQLDDVDNPQTPPLEDDCTMSSTMDYVGGYEDESATWQDSSLSKVYYKNNTETLNSLRRQNKVIEGDEVESPAIPQFIEPEAEPFDPSDPEEWDFLEELQENTAKDTKNVSKVIIFNKKNEILLLRRADKEKKWDLPGGHVQEGENFTDGASRETKEETNLDISSIKLVKTDKKDRIIKYFTAKKHNGNIILDPEEHIDYKWIKKEDLNEYSIIKRMKSVIMAQMKEIIQETEPYQRKVAKKHRKMKLRLLGRGKKTRKSTYKRAKSAPPGAGGA